MTMNVKDTVILLVSSLVQSLSQMLFIALMSIILILYVGLHIEETTRVYVAILARQSAGC